MPSFAALEARCAEAALAHLSNIVVDVGSGVLVSGIFDAEYAERFGLSGTQASVVISVTPPVAPGAVITLNAQVYRVTDVRPEGAGLSRLMLSEAG